MRRWLPSRQCARPHRRVVGRRLSGWPEEGLFRAVPQGQPAFRLIDESWDGGIGVLRAKVQGGNATWDVVQVEIRRARGRLRRRPVREDRLGQDRRQGRLHPAAVNDCGVGAILYDFVLGYDKDKLKDAPNGWADFFDTKKYPGKRALRAGPEDHAGNRPHGRRRRAEGRLQGAGDPRGRRPRLQEARHHQEATSIWWKAGAQPPQLLASGEVAMTSVYNGRIDAANHNDQKQFRYRRGTARSSPSTPGSS